MGFNGAWNALIHATYVCLLALPLKLRWPPYTGPSITPRRRVGLSFWYRAMKENNSSQSKGSAGNTPRLHPGLLSHRLFLFSRRLLHEVSNQGGGHFAALFGPHRYHPDPGVSHSLLLRHLVAILADAALTDAPAAAPAPSPAPASAARGSVGVSSLALHGEAKEPKQKLRCAGKEPLRDLS